MDCIKERMERIVKIARMMVISDKDVIRIIHGCPRNYDRLYKNFYEYGDIDGFMDANCTNWVIYHLFDLPGVHFAPKNMRWGKYRCNTGKKAHEYMHITTTEPCFLTDEMFDKWWWVENILDADVIGGEDDGGEV